MQTGCQNKRNIDKHNDNLKVAIHQRPNMKVLYKQHQLYSAKTYLIS